VTRPDGARIPIDRADPLGTLGHLVQEDLCLMERRGAEHVLTGAVLCFPASWRLSEKVGRPMIGIHEPVREYDATLARRVQRLLDGVRTGRPLLRFNVLTYAYRASPVAVQCADICRPGAFPAAFRTGAAQVTGWRRTFLPAQRAAMPLAIAAYRGGGLLDPYLRGPALSRADARPVRRPRADPLAEPCRPVARLRPAVPEAALSRRAHRCSGAWAG